MKEFDFHSRHVDAGRTFAPAGLTADAQIHHLIHCLRFEGSRAQLAAECEPQRVGAPARHVAFVLGRHIRWAHYPRVFAARTVVVAHLDGTAERSPRRPIENRVDRDRGVVRRITKERTVVHLRRPYDSAGIEERARIEGVLDVLERADQFRTEHRFVEFRTYDAIPVLARMRAAILAHDREGLFGNRPQLADILTPLHVQDGPHVQAADRRVGVPRTVRPVFFEDARQPLGVLGEMFQRDRAIFDDRDRL